MNLEPNQVVAGGLLRLLADTFVMLFKIRHFCWQMGDILGPERIDVIRQDHRHLDLTLDEIALNIIQLDREIAQDFSDLIKMSSIKLEGANNDLQTSLKQLIADHGQVIADINTLEVTLPSCDTWKDHDLLKRLAQSHMRCRDSLSTLISDPEDTLH